MDDRLSLCRTAPIAFGKQIATGPRNLSPLQGIGLLLCGRRNICLTISDCPVWRTGISLFRPTSSTLSAWSLLGGILQICDSTVNRFIVLHCSVVRRCGIQESQTHDHRQPSSLNWNPFYADSNRGTCCSRIGGQARATWAIIVKALKYWFYNFPEVLCGISSACSLFVSPGGILKLPSPTALITCRYKKCKQYLSNHFVLHPSMGLNSGDEARHEPYLTNAFGQPPPFNNTVWNNSTDGTRRARHWCGLSAMVSPPNFITRIWRARTLINIWTQLTIYLLWPNKLSWPCDSFCFDGPVSHSMDKGLLIANQLQSQPFCSTIAGIIGFTVRHLHFSMQSCYVQGCNSSAATTRMMWYKLGGEINPKRYVELIDIYFQS